MPYRFPRKLLRSGEPLKRETFDSYWQPLADLASGKLDAHNLDGGTVELNIDPAVNALYKPYYVEVASDPEWGDGTAGYTKPTVASVTATGTAHFVGQTSNWQVVDQMVHDDVVTGTSNLWIVAWCTYVLHGFAAGNGRHAGELGTGGEYMRGAGLQLAIRVDGQILPESITGHSEDWVRSFAAMKPTSQRDSTQAAGKKRSPGPGLRRSDYLKGIGPIAGAVRIVTTASVGPGTHTVEVVARTLQDYDLALLGVSSVASIGCAIHNRKLFVLDCPVFPTSAPSRTSVEVSAFEDGTVISNAALATNRNAAIVNALNDVDHGDVARGAFMNDHTPGAWLDRSTTSIGNGVQNMYCRYPGYDNDLITPNKALGNQGWYWLEDGAGNYLRTTSDATRGAVDWTTDGVGCLLIVLGNVQVHELEGQTDPQWRDHMGAFAIARQRDDTGTVDVLGSTEAYINNHIDDWHYVAGVAGRREIEVDVPLFHVFNFSPTNGGADPGFDIREVGVVGSSFSLSDSPNGPDIYYNRGNFTVIKLRG